MFYLVSQSDGGVRTGIKTLDQVPINGFQVVEVPGSIAIDEDVSPFDLAELNQQKYEGILASRPNYQFVRYDDLQDPSDINTSKRSGGHRAGSMFLPPTNASDGDGTVETNIIDVSSDGQFATFAVYWEVYKLTRVKTNRRVEKYFDRVDPDVLEMFISNDGGTPGTFEKGFHTESVQLKTTGSEVVIRFQNESQNNRFYIGGYGFLY